MLTLLPTSPNYLQWYDDIWTQKWFNYIATLSMDSSFNTTASSTWNDFVNWADMIYNAVSFAWHLLPIAESVFTSTASFPTKRKKIINTGYNSWGARTGLFMRANFLLNKNMDAGSNVWWTNLVVTIPLEIIINQISGASGFSAITPTCILKKVSTWWTITTLKTLTLVNSWSVNIGGQNLMNNYTFSDSTWIWSISAGDVLYVEVTVTGTGGAHTNSGDSETVSIITTGTNNLFASIP